MRKKVFLKSLAIFITLALISTMMTMVAASAASWNPSDQITIKNYVFDYSLNSCYYIGDSYITKGDTQKIQSDTYRVPEPGSTTIKGNYQGKDFGRVLKVTGNMYGYYTNGCTVGTGLVFTSNANTARLTYWVTGGNTNYGNGSNINSTTVQGSSGSYSWKQTIIYHANYPDGTDKTYKLTYTITSLSKVYNGYLELYKDCTGFKVPQNYELYDLGFDSSKPDISRCWHLEKDPTIDPNNPSNGFKVEGGNYSFLFKQADQNTTTHIYAQYTPTAVEYDVLHQDDDGTPLSLDTVPQGQSTDVLPGLPDKADGSTFEKWERIEGSTDQKYYDGGETITPTTDVVFEAVYNDPPKASSSEPSSSEPSSSEPSSSEPSSSEPSSSEPSSSEPSSSEPSSSEPSSSEPSSSEPSSSEAPSSSEPSSSEPSSSEPSSSEPSSSEPSSSEPSSSEPSSSEPSSSGTGDEGGNSSTPSLPSTGDEGGNTPSLPSTGDEGGSSSGTGDDGDGGSGSGDTGDGDDGMGGGDDGDDGMGGYIDDGDDGMDDIDDGDDGMDDGNGNGNGGNNGSGNGNGSANSNKNNTSVPETGDAFDFFLWISLWTIFGVGTLGFTLYNKKMNSYQKLDMSKE